MTVAEVDAVYSEVQYVSWRENPMIAALPDVISGEQFAEHVISFPAYDPSVRMLPAHDRMSFLCECEHLFIPFQHHISLYQRMTRLLRVGYQNRNPLLDANRQRQQNAVNEFNAPLKYGIAPHQPPTVQGFALTGMSGLGKSTALHGFFRLYPQVIVHREYLGKSIHQKQLVWLKLECPEDGSLKSLCRNFFESVDAIMGTNYTGRYVKETYSVSRILPHFARVAGLVNLGVLVIDEIQALKANRNQGVDVMLNFFTHLTNTIGIPVVLVGTPEAQDFLGNALHQIRRNSGQGEMQWGPLPQDEQWDNYIEALWKYQYLEQMSSLSKVEAETLHRVSTGVIGFATKIFIVAQERLINNEGEEEHRHITSELLEVVAREDFESAVKKLRKLSGDKKLVPAQVSVIESQSEKPKKQPKKVESNKPQVGSPDLEKILDPRKIRDIAVHAKAKRLKVYDFLRQQNLQLCCT